MESNQMESDQSTLPQFGHYRTKECLGLSNSANTYLVENVDLGRPLVIKQINPNLVRQDSRFLQYFKQEAQMLERLKHPHIVEIQDYHADEAYIIMPYAEGGTLRKLLNDEYPDGMTPQEALPILTQIVEGLAYAHEQIDPADNQRRGILHLDLKPENILIEEIRSVWGGKRRHYKIADFGIARWMNKNTGSPDGQSWLGAGTRGYRAPEQYIGGPGNPTVRSDVFSLGIIVHEMLSGHRPPMEAGKALRPLRELRNTISPKVEAVIQKATKDNPEDRYQSVTGFLNAFKQAVEEDDKRKEESLAAGPSTSTGTLPPSGKPPRSRRRLLQLAGGVLAILLLLTGLGTLVRVFWNQPTPPTTFCLATNLPLSGTDETAGREIQNGVDLALTQSSLPTGYHLDEFPMDVSSQALGSDPTVGIENIQNLPQETTVCPDPIAVIGPYSSALAVGEIPVAIEQRLLLLSPSNTAPCLTKQSWPAPPACIYNLMHPQGSNTYARLPGTDIDQGYQDADFLWRSANSPQSGLGARKIVIVGDEEVYGTQLAQAVIQRLQDAYGLTPVQIDCVKLPTELNTDPHCSLNPSIQAFSTENLAALAAQIAKVHPDAIFFAGFTDRGAGALRYQLGEVGLGQSPFVGGSTLISDGNTFFTAASPYTTNLYATFPAADPATFSSGSESEATFSSQYSAEFHMDPAGYSANGYDAANIIIQSIKDLIKRGQAVTSENAAQAVLNNDFGQDFTGVAGNRIHFDPNGDNIGPRQYTIEHGEPQSDGTWGWIPVTVVQIT
jgi:serine/threonine protein kinase